jgi:hypothetical protein
MRSDSESESCFSPWAGPVAAPPRRGGRSGGRRSWSGPSHESGPPRPSRLSRPWPWPLTARRCTFVSFVCHEEIQAQRRDVPLWHATGGSRIQTSLSCARYRRSRLRPAAGSDAGSDAATAADARRTRTVRGNSEVDLRSRRLLRLRLRVVRPSCAFTGGPGRALQCLVPRPRGH